MRTSLLSQQRRAINFTAMLLDEIIAGCSTFRLQFLREISARNSIKTHRPRQRNLEFVMHFRSERIDVWREKWQEGILTLKPRLNERKAEAGDEPGIPDDERLRERNRRPRPCPTTDWLRNHRVLSSPPPTNVIQILEWNIRYLILCVSGVLPDVFPRDLAITIRAGTWARILDTSSSVLTVEVEVVNRQPFKPAQIL